MLSWAIYKEETSFLSQYSWHTRSVSVEKLVGLDLQGIIDAIGWTI